jgi:hypothetical protein
MGNWRGFLDQNNIFFEKVTKKFGGVVGKPYLCTRLNDKTLSKSLKLRSLKE